MNGVRVKVSEISGRGIGMFLKALEMENFKSFRGEVVIPVSYTHLTLPTKA